MIEKLCNFLTAKIRKKMPDVDEERAEIINYGLQNILGEFPKMILAIGITLILGLWKELLVTLIVMIPYKAVVGGVHLKTHTECIIFTVLLYCGPGLASRFITYDPIYIKYILISAIWIFGILMITKYAPADTENVPILRKKERKQKKILSYIVLTVELAVAVIVANPMIISIILITTFVQTLFITKPIYILARNKYGHEVYKDNGELISQNS